MRKLLLFFFSVYHKHFIHRQIVLQRFQFAEIQTLPTALQDMGISKNL